MPRLNTANWENFPFFILSSQGNYHAHSYLYNFFPFSLNFPLTPVYLRMKMGCFCCLLWSFSFVIIHSGKTTLWELEKPTKQMK